MYNDNDKISVVCKFLDLQYNVFRGRNLMYFKGRYGLNFIHPELEDFGDWFYVVGDSSDIYPTTELLIIIRRYVPIENHIINNAVTIWCKENHITKKFATEYSARKLDFY